MKKIFTAACALLLVGSAYALPAWEKGDAANSLKIKQPIVEPTTPGQLATEVFMDVVNNGDITRTVVAATSPIAKKVQLHRFATVNGTRKMVQVKDITLKPHKDNMLEAGGFHIMLVDLKKSLKLNEKVPVTLIYADGSYSTIDATVKQGTV